MATLSMFETLMSLPIFSGANREQISLFVEKTHLDFDSFNPGETIFTSNDSCDVVVCLLSGEVRLSHALYNNSLVLEESVRPNKVLCIERLFGMDNRFRCSAMAISKCGIMKFSKNQYISLVQSDPIFLLNSLNYLSLKTQRQCDAILKRNPGDLTTFLASLIDRFTFRDSYDVVFRSVKMPIKDFFIKQKYYSESQFDQLLSSGLIKIVDSYSVAVLNRNLL